MIQSMQIMPHDIKVLAFDVFGTVVDWRSSVITEGEQLGKAKALQIDWPAFADAWRSIYRPYMDRVGPGKLPWTKLDDLHRQMLEKPCYGSAFKTLRKTKRKISIGYGTASSHGRTRYPACSD